MRASLPTIEAASLALASLMTHAAHQRARLFLYPMPFGPEGWARRKREAQQPREVSRLRWKVRAYTYEHVNRALGLLAMKAADAIRQRSAAYT